MTLTDLLAAHGAASWDRQLCLAELIGTNGWSLDVKRGEITFGGQHTFPVQILGSESDSAGTWLWTWGNEASELPAEFLLAARQIQEYGWQNDVSEFVTPEVSLEAVSGHLLSTIASGICQADAYYRGPYPGGAMFLLLSAPEARQFADFSAMHFIRVFTEFIMAFSCPHRPALQAYAYYKGYGYEETAENSVLCTSPDGEILTVRFDNKGRLEDIATTLHAEGTDAEPNFSSSESSSSKSGDAESGDAESGVFDPVIPEPNAPVPIIFDAINFESIPPDHLTFAPISFESIGLKPEKLEPARFEARKPKPEKEPWWKLLRL